MTVLVLLVSGACVAISLSRWGLSPSSSAVAAASRNSASDNIESMLLTTSEELYIRFDDEKATLTKDGMSRYLRRIRSLIVRPDLNLPRKLQSASTTKHFSQLGQSQFIDKRLKQRRHGFFLECGASDGEGLSNSLFFELERNWTGLLIEANPISYRSLVAKNRRAYVINSCLSPTGRPTSLSFRPAGLIGGLSNSMEPSHAQWVAKEVGARGNSDITIQCFPLMDILDALQINHIDYMSLDVEGPEVKILEQVDWTRLKIDVLTVEYGVVETLPKVHRSPKQSLSKLAQLGGVFNKTGLYRQATTLDDLDVVFERLDLDADK